MDDLLNDQKDRLNQPENSHKLCDETGHSLLSFMENQWKLRQQQDHNFPMDGKLF